MRTFIMGGTGTIGSRATAALTSNGNEVIGLARSEAARSRLNALGASTIDGDTEDLAAIRAGVDAADTVVFCAAIYDAETALVDWLIKTMAGSGKSLVFCSGTGVLAERTMGSWSENTFSEWDEFAPSRALDSRVQLERRVLSASQHGLRRGIVVRPPAVWTHEQPHMLVSNVFEMARSTGSACYIGEGLNMYSHIHAQDLGQVFRHAVERGQDGAVYHAVAGEVPNRWIAESVSRLTGVPTRSISMEEAIELWGKFAALIVFGVSSRSRSPRTRQEFNWTPQHTDMLASATRWMEQELQS